MADLKRDVKDGIGAGGHGKRLVGGVEAGCADGEPVDADGRQADLKCAIGVRGGVKRERRIGGTAA